KEHHDEVGEGRLDDGHVGASAKVAAASQMDAAVDALSRELTKLRTGRASEGMLDHIMVEYYGVKTPINRMAAISVSDPKTLKVTPYDPSAIVKVVAKSSEDVKQSIRRSRQKALDNIKKAAAKKKDKDKAGPSLSEDEVKRMEKEIDDLTKKYMKKADDMCKTKEKEIKQG
ncbi:ribosome-recycling factor, chloroplastic, partial [Dorcoceras hygrometricum]